MRLDEILDHSLSFCWNAALMLDIQCQALLKRMVFEIWSNYHMVVNQLDASGSLRPKVILAGK